MVYTVAYVYLCKKRKFKEVNLTAIKGYSDSKYNPSKPTDKKKVFHVISDSGIAEPCQIILVASTIESLKQKINADRPKVPKLNESDYMNDSKKEKNNPTETGEIKKSRQDRKDIEAAKSKAKNITASSIIEAHVKASKCNSAENIQTDSSRKNTSKKEVSKKNSSMTAKDAKEHAGIDCNKAEATMEKGKSLINLEKRKVALVTKLYPKRMRMDSISLTDEDSRTPSLPGTPLSSLGSFIQSPNGSPILASSHLSSLASPHSPVLTPTGSPILASPRTPILTPTGSPIIACLRSPVVTPTGSVKSSSTTLVNSPFAVLSKQSPHNLKISQKYLSAKGIESTEKYQNLLKDYEKLEQELDKRNNEIIELRQMNQKMKENQGTIKEHLLTVLKVIENTTVNKNIENTQQIREKVRTK